jgi:molecular chaperone DnaK (HSP70)
MQYAIDFGTSNTVVARINEHGIVETVKLSGYSSLIANNPALIPSYIYMQNAATEEVWIGQEVIDRGLDNRTIGQSQEPRFFKAFKRGIGSQLPMFVPELDDCEVSFELVGKCFLRKLIQQLPDVDSLIFTVPVDSFESYRQWLGNVCEELQIAQVRMIDEPTAAALGYGISGGDERLLVVDFGGGTLDLSLVQLTFGRGQMQSEDLPQRRSPLGVLLKWGDRLFNQNNNATDSPSSAINSPVARVIAKTGQNLGGIDIDNWVFDYFQRSLGLPKDAFKNSLVMRLVERIKIALSNVESFTEVYFDDQSFESYELTLTRSQLREILEQHKFFASLDRALSQIQQQAMRQNFDWEAINAVLFVGGTSQISAIQGWALEHFDPSKLKFDKPFEAIAHGAVAQNWQLQDLLYHSYGIRYWDKRYKRHNWHTIVKSGQAYPLENPVELTLGASIAKQSSIELVIGELGETDMEVYFENDRLITRLLEQKQVAVQVLNDSDRGRVIAKLDPLGEVGSDRVKVFFQVDRDRQLRITVFDLLTKQNLLEDIPVVQLI